eukprot:CAMPEP_0182468268 /NCGR_PEP_ID=MMETSP1319-20130603/15213_1 /TAXON_ID=172717 /ORGANISM="Bolidomonas pacifica, Strain RCC208" /LENGTH=397 /DNA_ID=CAMNT_0024668443 /DNA_START=54 /DNA_END=1247 /DNA_ORIENTATION=+
MNSSTSPFTSLEYYPPKTADGVTNLQSRIVRMLANTAPRFMDVTWGAGGSTSDTTLSLVRYIKSVGGVPNMHLTCTNMDPKLVRDALAECRKEGITNIVALRGDAPEGESEWHAAEGGFACALDLVKFIRSEYGSEFGISVAGYPEGHPNAIVSLQDGEAVSASERLRVSEATDENGNKRRYVCKDEAYAGEIKYLKEKVDAGADFVITQMFFDTNVFVQFVKDCRDAGIECPIVPGVMCINNYGGFFRMTGFCKTRVPANLKEDMEKLKDDSEGLKRFGVEFGVGFCERLVNAGCPCLHFYTLNLEKVVYGILDGMGWQPGLVSRTADGLDSDAATMKAAGSKWARKGDEVSTQYGKGVVENIREGGAGEIRITNWTLANGGIVKAYLGKGHFEKV